MTLPCTTIGAAKVLNTAVPDAGWLTNPVTTTLGIPPTISAPPVGVMILPTTTVGAVPAKVNAPTLGAIILPCAAVGS